MGQSRRPADRIAAPARAAQLMAPVILVTGFAPFGGESTNPSWEVARHLDGTEVSAATVKALRLPVNCSRAARMIAVAIEKTRPDAILGLGQAGGRPALSIEKVAINVADGRASRETDGGVKGVPVVRGGPDAYFSRLPIPAILDALKKRGIPAGLSLSAGVYVCNAVMYSALHTLRRRKVPAGFIHLPYEAAQAVRHRAAASMSRAMMAEGIALALETIARRL
jgi:pyroglutamyl-peptidase